MTDSGHRVSSWDDKNVLELYSSDGYLVYLQID